MVERNEFCRKRLSVTILNERTRVGHSEEGIGFMEIRRKNFPGRGSCLWQGLRLEHYLVCSRKQLGWREVSKGRSRRCSQRERQDTQAFPGVWQGLWLYHD